MDACIKSCFIYSLQSTVASGCEPGLEKSPYQQIVSFDDDFILVLEEGHSVC